MTPGLECDRRQSARQFLRQGQRQAFDGKLGRTVGSHLGGHRSPPTGTEVHHHPASLLDHGRQKVADDVEHAADVDVDHFREFVRRNLPQFAAGVDEPGIVDEQVRHLAGGNEPRSVQRPTARSSATSTQAKSWGGPYSFAISSTASPERAHPKTSQPASTNRSTIARPSPRETPVRTTRRRS